MWTSLQLIEYETPNMQDNQHRLCCMPSISRDQSLSWWVTDNFFEGILDFIPEYRHQLSTSYGSIGCSKKRSRKWWKEKERIAKCWDVSGWTLDFCTSKLHEALICLSMSQTSLRQWKFNWKVTETLLLYDCVNMISLKRGRRQILMAQRYIL